MNCQPMAGFTCREDELHMTKCFHICGNGDLDPGEECDDFNSVSNDGCSDKCFIEKDGP